jgi:hypothetical protein
MPRPTLVPLIVCALTLACERPGESDEHARAVAARVFKGALAYPGSVVVSLGAGEDAAEIVLATAASPDTVVAWYQETFRMNGWTLRGASRAREGTVTLYAERDGRPLWVRLWSAGSGGTRYSLIGAEVADTAR